MKRKNIITSIILIVFIIIPVCVCSANGETTETFTAIADFTFGEAKIYHTPVGNVIPEQSYMNIKLNVAFGDYKNVDRVELLYYFGSDTSDIYTVVNSDRVLNRKDFFIKTDTWIDNSSSISYQVRVTLKMQDGSVGYAYWPEQLTVSSNTFHTAPIALSVSGTVSDGGSLDMERGDQAKQDGGIDLSDELGDGAGTTNVTLRVLHDELNDSPSGRAVSGLSVILSPEAEDHQKLMRVRIPLENTVQKKFVMVYRKDDSIPWAKGRVIKIEKVKNDLVYSGMVPRMSGQYGLFESTDLDDSDYRPEKRVKIKSRIASGKYNGFEFKGLKEGDVVKIYNVSGKKIAEITDVSALGVAYWKGKKGTNNSEDWAESGTYIYQIKLKEKNKIVSGTIAFVW